MQYTVTTVMWKNAPGRWYGLLLMATSSSSLLRSCSQIVMCPMFHYLLLRNTASLPAFLSPLYYVVSSGSHLTWWSHSELPLLTVTPQTADSQWRQHCMLLKWFFFSLGRRIIWAPWGQMERPVRNMSTQEGTLSRHISSKEQPWVSMEC